MNKHILPTTGAMLIQVLWGVFVSVVGIWLALTFCDHYAINDRLYRAATVSALLSLMRLAFTVSATFLGLSDRNDH